MELCLRFAEAKHKPSIDRAGKTPATLLLIEFVYLVASLTPSDIGRDHLILSADQVTTDEHEANSRSLLQRCRIRSVLAALPKKAILMSGRPFIRERR
jgi:hypothetical protein